MGSSCTTGTKPQSNQTSTLKKYQINNKNNLNKNLSFKKNANPVTKEQFEECFVRNNKLSNASTQVYSFNNIYQHSHSNFQAMTGQITQSSSTQHKSLDTMCICKLKPHDTNTSHKENTIQNNNCPLHSINSSSKFESPKTSQQKSSTTNKSRRKISYVEIFILERKRYMQDKGIYNYTPYTLLPAPKLKKLQNNPLFQKRKQSLPHLPSSVLSNENGTLTNATHIMSPKSIQNSTNYEQKSSCKNKTNEFTSKGDSNMIQVEI